MGIRLLGLILLLILVEIPRTTSAEEAHDFRFHGAPRPACTEFFLLETSLVQTSIAGHLPRLPEDTDAYYFSWEVGAMTNVSVRHAWGTSLYVASDLVSTRVGVAPRFRRWLGRHFASDLSTGVYLFDSDVSAPASWPGCLARWQLQYSDVLSFATQLDLVKRDSKWEGRVYAGLRVGSYPASFMFPLNMIAAVGMSDHGFRPDVVVVPVHE